MLRILKCFLYWVLNIFSFGIIEALDSKGILNTLKKAIMSAMECADVAGFTFATRQITLQCFLCNVISAEVTVINLVALLRVFLVG